MATGPLDHDMRVTRRWCLVVAILLWAWIVFSAASFAADLSRVSFIGRLEHSCLLGGSRGCSLEEERALVSAGDSSDQQQLVIAITSVAMLVVTAIAWMIWQSRANRMLREKIGVTNLDFTPRSSVGWWFVPFANLVKPYRAVSELWRASDPQYAFAGWRSELAPWHVRLWWTAWIATGVAGRLALTLSRNEQTTSGSSFNSARQIALLGLVISAGTTVAAVFAVWVVTGIQRRQEQTLAAALARVKSTAFEEPRPDLPAPLPLPNPALGALSTTSTGELELAPDEDARARPGDESNATKRLVRIGGIVTAGVAVAAAAVVIATAPSVPSSASGSKAPGTAPTINVEPLASGWRQYEDAEGGFVIGLPPDWNRATPKQAETRFLAVRTDPAPATGYLGVSVIVTPIGDVSLDDFSSASAHEIEISSDVHGAVTQESVEEPAGPAIRLGYQIDDGQTQVVQYLLVHDQTAFVVTFAAPMGESQESMSAFDEIIRTFAYSH